MPSGNCEACLVPFALCFQRKGHSIGVEPQIPAHEVSSGTVKAVADDFIPNDRFGKDTGLRIVEVEDGPACAVNEMCEERPQLCHFLVVETTSGQHRNLGIAERDRAVTLVHLPYE